MKAIYEGYTFTIGWKYYKSKKKNKPPRKTECYMIQHFEGTKELPAKEIGIVSINLWSNDVHCKDTARKYSLHKLLNKVLPGRSMKGARKVFWDAYFTRKKVYEHESVMH